MQDLLNMEEFDDLDYSVFIFFYLVNSICSLKLELS